MKSSGPVRVLYLTMNPNRSSTTVPTEGWLRVLPSEGLEPVLVTREAGDFYQWTRSRDIPAFQVSIPVPSEFSFRALAAVTPRLWGLARRYRIQLIHCNEQDIYPVGQYLGKICRVPVVVSVHFTMDRGFSQWAFGGSRNPARIFFVSGGNQEACRQGLQGVIPETKWRILPNGLDLSHHRPDETQRARFRLQHGLDSGPVIGVACALRPRKQLEHLFQAVSRLNAPDLRVCVAGAPVKGDEEYADQLLRDGKKLLGSQLVTVGHLVDLRGFYNALDLFVNTSQEEACSISVLESLASGCPVLGYPSKSVDGQILPDGGEIVDQDNVEQLTATVKRWMEDPRRLRQARLGARRTAEERFDIEKISRGLWSEYESVLSRH